MFRFGGFCRPYLCTSNTARLQVERFLIDATHNYTVDYNATLAVTSSQSVSLAQRFVPAAVAYLRITPVR